MPGPQTTDITIYSNGKHQLKVAETISLHFQRGTLNSHKYLSVWECTIRIDRADSGEDLKYLPCRLCLSTSIPCLI